MLSLTRIIIILIVSVVSCFDGGSGNSYSENFNDSNRPELEYNEADDYFFLKPWNYELSYNATRKYPLLVYLHGSSQVKYLKNLYYMGAGYYNWDDTINNMTAEYQITVSDEFRKKSPCFVLIPQESGSSWNTAGLIAFIEQLKARYRIDTDRFYLHGFSMGGSGTYALAKDYYSYNKQLFAGIIRLNGYASGGTLADDIVNKSSIWLMVGLTDSSSTISNVRTGYEFLKKHVYYSGAVEKERLNYIITNGKSDVTANTVSLTKNGIVSALKTEYPDKGHFITEFPFWDPEVMAWLFSQTLKNR